MARGNVKWFNVKKGFGFITPDGMSDDCFVHYSQVIGDGFRTLNDGDRVEFEMKEGSKGLQAEQVTVVSQE